MRLVQKYWTSHSYLLPSTCFLFSFLVYHCSQNYKAIDLIAEAYARTWGDFHAWIHINKSDNSKKKKKNLSYLDLPF